MLRSIPRFLLEIVQRLPDKTAMVSRERSVTVSQLHGEALATAECLREVGGQAGDRVGICMEKTVDQASVILGVICANAELVPMLRRLKGPNIRHSIDNSGMG